VLIHTARTATTRPRGSDQWGSA